MDGRQKATALIVTGIILLGLNYVALAGFVAGQVEAGVADQVATGYDEESDYTNDDWNNSTAERVYFAYSMTNSEDLTENSAIGAEFEKMGPFIYEVTTHRELLDFDESAGTVTYSEYDVFDWCANCTWADDDGNEHPSLPGTTNVTNANILWNTQRIAGISTGIIYGEIFAKAGFSNLMIANDLSNKAPSIWAAEDISDMQLGAASQLELAGYDAATAAAMAPVAVLSGAYDNWNASAGGEGSMNPDFSGSADSILHSAVDPSDPEICIALTCDIGPMLVAGMGEPSESVTPIRAALLGYGSTDPVETTLMDWAVYGLAGTTFLANGGGEELTRGMDDLRDRLRAVSGVDISNADALNNVIFGVEGEELGNGMLSETDYNGIPLHGVALFLLGAQGDAFTTMVQYGIGLTQLLDLSDYAGGWIGMVGTPIDFPMILAGGSGTMNADQWWQIAFGSEEPLAGGYFSIGLNQGPYEGTVELSVEKVQEILYNGPWALTGDFASVFMYNELAGTTMPMNEDWTGFVMGGEVVEWDDTFVANAYDISESDAAALRSWVKNFMFSSVIGSLLGFQYGGSPYTTQSMDNWLYGWRDSIVADVVYGDISNMDVGWVSLETNETYFGSDNVSTGDFSVYVASTGTGAHADDGTLGQRLMEGYINSDGNGYCDFKLNADGTEADADSDGMYPCEEGEIYGLTGHLPWRAPHREASTYGLLTDHVGNDVTELAGTIGDIGSADEPFKYNLVGYSITDSVPGEMGEFKGVPMRHHTITLDPAENQIQAKLIGSASYVDVLPGALPVYFGSEVEVMVEPITNMPMYGKSVSMFHLDLRGAGNMNPEFGVDTHPVFEIHTLSELPDDSAETLKCKVLKNTDPMYWTDFGGEGDCALEGTAVLDYITASLYVASIAMIAFGGVRMGTRD